MTKEAVMKGGKAFYFRRWVNDLFCLAILVKRVYKSRSVPRKDGLLFPKQKNTFAHPVFKVIATPSEFVSPDILKDRNRFNVYDRISDPKR